MEEKTSGDVNADRDVILGDQVNITYVLKMPGFEPPSDLKRLRADYLAYLGRSYRALDFKGIPQLETLSRDLLLEDVYVPLVARPELPAGETWERRLAGRAFGLEALPDEVLTAVKGAGSAPVRVEEALADRSRVVVLGDPGSGKTTLLKHMALRLAGEPEAPLPILMPLNAYADALARADRNLQAYLPEYFAGLAQDVSGLAPLFDMALAQGRAVILLDGLDEVQRDRPHLVNKVQAFARKAAERGNKLVITSRIVGYRESPLDPGDWSLYTLLDFDDAAIEQFAGKWCVAFERSTLGDTPEACAAAKAEREGLLRAIRANPGVAHLASNPLLLTILALIKRQGVTLPNRRVELYELYLKTLISAWSKARTLDKKPVGPPLDYLQTISVLGPLALWLREENPTAGLVPEERLIEWLTQHFVGEDWGLRPGPAAERARQFLESVRKYSNLLLERGQGRFGFIHLTFEEALAARGLVQLGQLGLDDSLAVIQLHLTDPGWRETILLAVGIWGLVREEPKKAGAVVRAVLKMEPAAEAAGHNVLLAGACLEDVGELGLGRVAAGEVTQALLTAVADRSLPPAAQRDAGFRLGCTGWVPDDLDVLVSIPAGPFLYGHEKQEVEIGEPFAIGKYLVTNLQYRRFLEADGYHHRAWWGEEGWAWRSGSYDSRAPEAYRDWLSRRPPEKRGEPFFWGDTQWNNPLAPVVGVSWFEAEAYCRWLSGELGRPVRLPCEEEWERAARHTDGREYPWGGTFERDRLNCAEFWGGRDDLDWDRWVEDKGYETASTTIVGQFPAGNSQAGVSDMAGNVWEWMDPWYDRQEIYRVLRGGSWYVVRGRARCAYRDGGVPGRFSNSVGFRVVSPGSVAES
jgi:formylglycine-generating enzyme required for sulfatase activity/energy-coupling factor transporter ATP-binding protein EcfA2